jgi:hypothetical protein
MWIRGGGIKPTGGVGATERKLGQENLEKLFQDRGKAGEQPL